MALVLMAPFHRQKPKKEIPRPRKTWRATVGQGLMGPCKEATVKPEFSWRPKDTEEVRTVGHQSRRAAGMEQSQLQEDSVCAQVVELKGWVYPVHWSLLDFIMSSRCSTRSYRVWDLPC